jgi:beta-glucosidase/6-phospho-beta-glucosidase/beta-galactosidase
MSFETVRGLFSEMTSAARDDVASPFQSFWMGGFECTDQVNAFGHRVDFLNITRHLELLAEDYRALKLLNIRTVREGIRWSRIEREPYTYDWSVVERMMDCANAHGIQQVWDLCHFGYPDDLTPLHPMFVRRFTALCRAFATRFRSLDATRPMIVTPMNEVSFVSWLGGDVRGTSPFCRGQGWEVKYMLMKAYIAGVEVLREVDPGVRLLTTEPLVSITHGHGAAQDERETARLHHEHQFQVTDMLTGRLCPELGGRPEYLDLLGCNFYYDNQWVHATHEVLDWKNPDARWTPLHRLLEAAYARYGRPVVLSETSHPKEDRPLWMDTIARECVAAIQAGVPLLGVCWYPMIDRPDWDHLEVWHQSGVWDRVGEDGDRWVRRLHEPTAAAFLRAQTRVAGSVPRSAVRVPGPAAFAV